MHKMPYKHIAAHLKKTELACRLHYHQMSYGNNGRRRSDSVSSIGSLSTISAAGEPSDVNHVMRLSPVISPRSTPEPGSQRAANEDASSHSVRAPVPILPKPDGHMAPTTLEPPVPLAYGKKVSGYFGQDVPMTIDMSRLEAIYKTFSASFWSKIAAEYSRDTQGIAPHLAEQAIMGRFHHSGAAQKHLPPTPSSSPTGSPEPQQHHSLEMESSPALFRAVNSSKLEQIPLVHNEDVQRSPADRCSVSSLLTDEREVRPMHR